ncbi:MAG: hypothetical protein M3384_17950 [Acidobacteriota bacterium]|nr:hypothetical protein [Acidobacteriota bacterium]
MNGKTALGLDNNVGALVCYLGNLVCMLGLIYSIIVIVQDKTNRLPRFHAWQSVLLSIAPLTILIVYFILAAIGVAIDTAIGVPIFSIIAVLLYFVLLLAFLAMFVFMIIAAIKAFNGEIYKIPVIGNMAEKYAGV